MTEDADGWTIETLKEYVLALIEANDVRYNQRFEASQNAINTALTSQQEAMKTALTSQKLAVDKAEIAAEKRFESVNEFRGVLINQQNALMPRVEANALFRSIEDKMEAQRLSHEKNIDAITLAISDLRLSTTHLLSIETYEARHSELQRQVNDLRESRSEVSGKSSGANALWGYIVGAAGIVLALVFHFVK